MRTLILGLGNPILTDDSVGIHVVREIKRRNPQANVVEMYAGGIRLIEALRGYNRAFVVDAMVTKEVPCGTIISGPLQTFTKTRTALSVHDMDFSTALELGRLTEVPLPTEVTLWGIEAKDIDTFGEGLSPEVEAAIPQVVREVLEKL